MRRSLSNLLRNSPRRIRVGVLANLLSAIMLVGIAVFWLASPQEASAGAFGIEPDTAAARAYAQITAIFKAIGDILPPVFAITALLYRQWHLAGVFNALTLVLVPGVDMVVWGVFAGPDHILMHAPFAIPLALGAYCLLGQSEDPSISAERSLP